MTRGGRNSGHHTLFSSDPQREDLKSLLDGIRASCRIGVKICTVFVITAHCSCLSRGAQYNTKKYVRNQHKLYTMKTTSFRLAKTLLTIITVGMVHSSSTAATLVMMTFDNSNSDIEEDSLFGWNGTTALGGSLATGLTVSSGMKIYGSFVAHTKQDAFVAHNWSITNTSDTRVGMTISALSGNTFSLGGGSEIFATRLHHTPEPQDDAFTSVFLFINGTEIGSQSYIYPSTAQTLTWNIGNIPSLNNLTEAIIDLKFSSLTGPGGPNHGPQWELSDGAFVSLTGTVNAIPEPSQAILACLGMGLALIRRRR